MSRDYIVPMLVVGTIGFLLGFGESLTKSVLISVSIGNGLMGFATGALISGGLMFFSKNG